MTWLEEKDPVQRGKRYVEEHLSIHRCIHCARITVRGPDSRAPGHTNPDRCECGAELYPMSRRVILGRAMTLREVAGEVVETLERAESVESDSNWPPPEEL